TFPEVKIEGAGGSDIRLDCPSGEVVLRKVSTSHSLVNAVGVAAASSYVGTWKGQAWRWPITLVVSADDGKSVTLDWIGSRTDASGELAQTSPSRYTVPRTADGSLTVQGRNQVTGQDTNALENLHFCGADICAVFFQML